MTQILEPHTKQLTATDAADTDHDWITGSGANEQTLTQQLIIQNNDTVEQTVSLKLQRYSDGYSAVLTKTYTIAAGSSEFPAEFMGQALIGDESNPDKITVAFDTALTVSDTIDCVASAVKFT